MTLNPTTRFFFIVRGHSIPESVYRGFSALTPWLVSGHAVQIKGPNPISPGICAMDYRGNDPYLNPHMVGLIPNYVGCFEQQCIYLLISSLDTQVMQQIMVESLPSQCRLTVIFDVSQIHSDSQTHWQVIRRLVILGPSLVRRYPVPVIRWLTISKVFPILYANSSSSPQWLHTESQWHILHSMTQMVWLKNSDIQTD